MVGQSRDYLSKLAEIGDGIAELTLSDKDDLLESEVRPLGTKIGTCDIEGRKLGSLLGATEVKGEPDKEDGTHCAAAF